jgi:hypothetical protein
MGHGRSLGCPGHLLRLLCEGTPPLALRTAGEGQPKGAPQQDLSLPRNWAQLLDSTFGKPMEAFCVQVNTDGWHHYPPQKRLLEMTMPFGRRKNKGSEIRTW